MHEALGTDYGVGAAWVFEFVAKQWTGSEQRDPTQNRVAGTVREYCEA